MKKFLLIGIISVLVASIAVVGKGDLKNSKIKDLEAKVFEAKTYINHNDLGNAEIVVNILKRENKKLGDNNIVEDIEDIEKSIELKRNFGDVGKDKSLSNLSSDEKNLALLNIYLENNEVASDVRSIQKAGKEYYVQYRRNKGLEYDENKDFSNSAGYIVKPISTTKRFHEDTCLIFDNESSYCINGKTYYKFTEIPVGSYFGDENEVTWFLADLNFNIISKENLEFYIHNGEVIDYNDKLLSSYDLTRYIEDMYLY